MADSREYGYFWNAEESDRVYDADSFSDWLTKFFKNGVFEGDLLVKSDSGMSVLVKPGYSNINGKVRFFDSDTTLTLDAANSTYPRIDTIVVRCDYTQRKITLEYVKGAYSGTNPIPTAPTRTAAIYELVLANIFVDAGVTSITQADITDKRTDTSVCGYITGTVTEMDYEQFALQFESYFAQFKADNEADFLAWFNNLVYVLDGDVAGHLQNEIDALDTRIDNLKTGGSIVKAQFETSFSGQTATLTVDGETYTATISSTGLAEFDGVLEIGSASVTSGEANVDFNIPCYSLYEVSPSSSITLNLTVHSAANDTVYYYVDSVQTTLCTTNANGTGTGTITVRPNSSVTFYSTVAKDTTTGTTNYQKNVSLSDSITDLKLMPEGAIYWYGWKIGDYTNLSNEQYQTTNFTTNSVQMKATATFAVTNRMFNQKIDLSQYSTVKATTNLVAYEDASLVQYLTYAFHFNTTYGTEVQSNYVYFGTGSGISGYKIKSADISSKTDNAYPAFYIQYYGQNSYSYMYALWLE